MKIAIVGGGAVGLGIASCLIRAGSDVTIVAKPETVELLLKNGLSRIGIFGDYLVDSKKIQAYNFLPNAYYDFILPCIKSFDSELTAKELAKNKTLFDSDSKIVLCQNGWGNAEIFSSYFPRERIFNARVITGFSRSKLNEVKITVHAQPIRVGSLFVKNVDPVIPLCQAIKEGGVPCELADEIEKDLIAKLLYNCALNALGAIFKASYGKLGEKEESRELMKEMVEEVFNVMEDRTTYWATADDYLHFFYSNLLPLTYEHESSMLQDIRLGKRTEIEAINGAVVKLGKKKDVSTPYNSMIVKLIKFLESEKLSS